MFNQERLWPGLYKHIRWRCSCTLTIRNNIIFNALFGVTRTKINARHTMAIKFSTSMPAAKYIMKLSNPGMASVYDASPVRSLMIAVVKGGGGGDGMLNDRRLRGWQCKLQKLMCVWKWRLKSQPARCWSGSCVRVKRCGNGFQRPSQFWRWLAAKNCTNKMLYNYEKESISVGDKCSDYS